MRYGVGIDLGTSFTSAAISSPGSTRMVPMSPSMIVPSVAYRVPGGALLTGDAALSPDTDPRKVARNFKRRLGDPAPLFLGGATYSAAALMAAQLRDVISAATRITGGPPESVVLTYPAVWGPYRREHFTEVPRLANIPDVRLLTEPEAAATHYSTERRLGDGEVIAVYDLGGGTFDSTVLRMRDGRMEILGTPEGVEQLGGVDFDRAIRAHLDQRLDGAISELDPSDPRDATALTEIEALCVRAKEALSTEPDVRLSVPMPAGPREITITRLQFNEMIAPTVRLTIDALHRTTQSAGLRIRDLSAVLLAGGSSQVPLVRQQIAEEFAKPVRAALHPKYTVALGAAQLSVRPVEAPVSVPVSSPIEPPAPPEAPARTTPPPGRDRKWLVAGGAVGAALLAGLAATSFITTADTPRPKAIYSGEVAPGLSGFVGSDENNWQGADFSHEPDGALRVDPAADGLRATWTGDLPAQLYVQVQKGLASIDFPAFLEHDGALVFTAEVHSPPAGYVGIGLHCTYPCGVERSATELFRRIPPGTPTRVAIPLSCFAESDPRPPGVPPNQLDPSSEPDQVDTPFLVFSDDRLDVTFSDVRWEPGAAADLDCDEVL
ncbi:Hsp70 family protein [Saccharopolyspora sp. MS10]|uniref:Hsp70 family protein n=1 Tax=Saccharopolyspora sp. MS10 TaxID=3385973 RepID=UPI0039A3DEAB